MNKFLLSFFLILFFSPTALADSWDDFSNLDRMWDGQKSITNQEFEKVIEKLEEPVKKKEEKQEKKKRKKLFGGGTTLHEELNPDNKVNEIESILPKEDLIVNSPVYLLIDGKTLDKGYYKVIGERDKDTKKIYLNFYQSQFFKGKVEAVETDEDYGEEELNFAKILPHNESFMKIIFGSIDFNAYAFIPYAE